MKRRIAPILMLLLAGPWGPPGSAAAEKLDEEKAAKVKAAYVLNFVRFTRWPDRAFEDAEAPLVIAVVGEGVLRPVLEKTVAGKRHEERAIVVRRFPLPRRGEYEREERYRGAVAGLQQALRQCHAVYFSDPALKQAAGYLNAIRSEPILSIGEGRAYAERGAMLALAVDRGRIVFYANAGAVEAAPLAVSSKLLRLARVIETE